MRKSHLECKKVQKILRQVLLRPLKAKDQTEPLSVISRLIRARAAHPLTDWFGTTDCRWTISDGGLVFLGFDPLRSEGNIGVHARTAVIAAFETKLLSGGRRWSERSVVYARRADGGTRRNEGTIDKRVTGECKSTSWNRQ